jgi:hypothetical protein
MLPGSAQQPVPLDGHGPPSVASDRNRIVVRFSHSHELRPSIPLPRNGRLEGAGRTPDLLPAGR